MRPAGSHKATWIEGRSWMSPVSVLVDKPWKAGGGYIAESVSLGFASQTFQLSSPERMTCPDSMPALSQSLETAVLYVNTQKSKKAKSLKKKNNVDPYCPH